MVLLGLWRVDGQDLDVQMEWGDWSWKRSISREMFKSRASQRKVSSLVVSGVKWPWRREWNGFEMWKLLECQDQASEPFYVGSGESFKACCCGQPTSSVLRMGFLNLKVSCLLMFITYISFVLIFTHDLLTTNNISDVSYIISFIPHHSPLRVNIFISSLFRQRNQSPSERPMWIMESGISSRAKLHVSVHPSSLHSITLLSWITRGLCSDSEIKQWNQ